MYLLSCKDKYLMVSVVIGVLILVMLQLWWDADDGVVEQYCCW